MTLVMGLTIDIPKIARNQTLSLQEKKQAIKQLMNSHPHVTGENEQGQTLLNLRNYNPEGANRYIEQRGPLLVNAEGRCGWTILMALALTDSVDVAQWLIESQGALLNLGNDCGETPLHAACTNGQIGMLEMLISKGANVNQVTTSLAGDNSLGNTYAGMAPLHSAVRFGQIECIKILLRHGANIDLKIKSHDLNPLKWAKLIGYQVNAAQIGENIALQTANNCFISTADALGETQHREKDKVPSPAAMNDIIRILEEPSIYLHYLQQNKEEPNQLISYAPKDIKKKFRLYLVAIYKCTGKLPEDLQSHIDGFLFQKNPLNPKVLTIHIANIRLDFILKQASNSSISKISSDAEHQGFLSTAIPLDRLSLADANPVDALNETAPDGQDQKQTGILSRQGLFAVTGVAEAGLAAASSYCPR